MVNVAPGGVGAGIANGSWWVVVPTADQNASDSYKQQVDFRVQYPPGSAGAAAMLARQPYNDPDYGMWFVYWKGPFTTEAQAQTAQAATGSPENPAAAAVKAAENNPTGTLPGPLTGLNAIGDFAQRLSQPGTWIRVAEFGIGAILVIAGINHLLNNPIGKAVKTGSKAAAVAAI